MVCRTKRAAALIRQALLCTNLLLLSACFAQTTSADPSIVRHESESEFLPRERVLDVQLPKSYFEDANKTYPVLLHIAPDRDSIEMTRETVHDLAEKGRVPEMIVVSLKHSRRDRPFIRPVIDGGRTGEHADHYLEHLEKEVIPFLETQYRISDDRILAGWSRFGIFATFAMTHKPGLFTGHIVRSSAPNGEALHPALNSLLSNNSALSTVLHVSIGTEGNERRRRDAFDELEALLLATAPPKLRWRAEVIEGAGHVETFQIGLRNGLLFYFADR